MKLARITEEVFLERLARLSNEEIILKGQFYGNNDEVTLYHTVCKREFSVTARAFLQLPKCRLCSKDDFLKERHKKNKQAFYRKFTLMPHSNEYVLITEYQKSDIKIKLRHKICGKPFLMTPNKLLNGQQCPNKECVSKRISKRKRKTLDEFKLELYFLWNREYTVVGEYRGNRETIAVFHAKCQNIIDVTPGSLLKKHGCSICANNYKRNTEEFEYELQRVYGYEYSVLGSYINRHHPVLIRHNVCGTSDLVVPNSLLKKHGCANCAGNRKLSTDELYEKLKSANQSHYILLSQYQNMKTPIHVYNVVCNHKYWAYPEALTKGSGCPICNMSRGEARIARYLHRNNLEYQFQYTFDDCKNKKLLRFDFAVFNKSKEIKMLIEFDGEFHYFPIFGVEELLYIKLNDSIKNLYCEENEIPLLRIAYYDIDNIEKLLSQKLSKNKKKTPT